MICLFLDSFNKDYLKYTPFIKKLADENLSGNLEQPFGFTSSMASFVTGCWPDKHGIIDLFEKTDKHFSFENKYLVSFLRYLQGKHFYYSPLKVTEKKYFKCVMNKYWAQRDCLKINTIFDIISLNSILQNTKKKFVCIDYPISFYGRYGKLFFNNSIENVFKLTRNAAKNKKVNFILSHVLDLDNIGHNFGVDSEEMKIALKEIDELVKRVSELAEKTRRNLIIFSDHGMRNITGHIDLEKELDTLNLKYGKDYIYILGSTYARFWFFNNNAKEKVTNLLNKSEGGNIVNKKEYNLPNTDDLIFLAPTGIVFNPNFYGCDYQAMHGWNPKDESNQAFYLIKGFKGKKDARMIDLMPTILELMNIKQTVCDGKSLVKGSPIN